MSSTKPRKKSRKGKERDKRKLAEKIAEKAAIAEASPATPVAPVALMQRIELNAPSQPTQVATQPLLQGAAPTPMSAQVPTSQKAKGNQPSKRKRQAMKNARMALLAQAQNPEQQAEKKAKIAV